MSDHVIIVERDGYLSLYGPYTKEQAEALVARTEKGFPKMKFRVGVMSAPDQFPVSDLPDTAKKSLVIDLNAVAVQQH